MKEEEGSRVEEREFTLFIEKALIENLKNELGDTGGE